MLWGYSAQDNLADYEKIACKTLNFPSDCAALHFKVQMPFDAAGMLLAIAIYMHNVKKGNREIKMLRAKIVWQTVIALVYKPSKLVITRLIGGVPPLQQLLLQSVPNLVIKNTM